MKRVFVSLLSVLLVFGITACSQKKVAVVDKAAVTSSEQLQQDKKSDSKAAQQVSKGAASENLTEKSLKLSDRELKELADKKRRELVNELQAKVQDIHFAFDRYDITNDSKTTLKKVAENLSNNNKLKVIVEGHCDERGTNEYNLALGDKRANAAKEYLKTLGISSSMVETISYGEEKSACSESNEDCWSKNRRDHFVLAEN